MTPRNALQMTHAATDPQVFMCRQCMAVRVEEKDGLCPPCVRLIAAGRPGRRVKRRNKGGTDK